MSNFTSANSACPVPTFDRFRRMSKITTPANICVATSQVKPPACQCVCDVGIAWVSVYTIKPTLAK